MRNFLTYRQLQCQMEILFLEQMLPLLWYINRLYAPQMWNWRRIQEALLSANQESGLLQLWDGLYQRSLIRHVHVVENSHLYTVRHQPYNERFIPNQSLEGFTPTQRLQVACVLCRQQRCVRFHHARNLVFTIVCILLRVNCDEILIFGDRKNSIFDQWDAGFDGFRWTRWKQVNFTRLSWYLKLTMSW